MRGLALIAWFVFATACGGAVQEDRRAAGGAGGTTTGGSSSGGVNTGGTPASGGVTGGAPASGGTAGTPCTPPPDCNWCNGKPLLDAHACTMGWVCANGINPCVQGPCQNDCPSGQSCLADGLCWPQTTPATCTTEVCSGTSYDCTCKWSCSDGSEYTSWCTIDSYQTNCGCLQNAKQVNGCTWLTSDGGAPNACGNADGCCSMLPH